MDNKKLFQKLKEAGHAFEGFGNMDLLLIDKVKDIVVEELTGHLFSYHPENLPRDKTFRDFKTGNWYWEYEVVNILGKRAVEAHKR